MDSITFNPREVSAYYAVRVPHLKQSRAADWRGPCPIHHGKDDNFAVNAATGEGFCHSQCGRGWDILALEMELTGADFKTAKAGVFRLVGRPDSGTGNHPPRARIAATYNYKDEAGKLLYQAVRMEPKQFWQRRPDGHGGWIKDLKGVRLVLYRLPELRKRSSETIYICEGEKDVETLESLGLLATCNPLGAGAWRPEYSESIHGRSVVILVDNDAPGRKHAVAVAADVLRVGCEVRIVEVPTGKDVSDWIAAGGTLARFSELTEAAAPLDVAALSEMRTRWELAEEEPRRHPSSPAEGADDWPKPEPIQSELPPVKAFSENLLPATFRPLVRDVAERMQVPMDFPAVISVLCLAGAVNRRATIQPRANDTAWVVVPNLWGGIIALPGLMKSPVIHSVTRPLNQIQAEWRREHEQALKEYARAKEEYELRLAAWREQYKASKKNGKVAPNRPEDELGGPTERRLIANDATFEALHQIMSQNPAGILVTRDELTGWLSQLERVGREGERAFCLEAWNGDSSFTIDRIGRGTIHVPHCCMSMLGGIQPGRLRSYLVDALEDGPSNDGLIQRFQLLVWPDTAPDWTYVDRVPDAASEQQAARVFRKLVELDAGNPVLFRFAPDAQELFVEWFADLEAKVRGDELHPALISHLSKYRSLMPSLALLFELADRAPGGFDGFEGPDSGKSQNFCVSLDHARQSAAFCEYLESHARRVYSCVVTPQLRAARELAGKIKKRKMGADGFFSCRDVYLKGWSGLDTPEAVKLAAEVLLDARWVRSAGGESSDLLGRGRPSNRYEVNPRVWE